MALAVGNADMAQHATLATAQQTVKNFASDQRRQQRNVLRRFQQAQGELSGALSRLLVSVERYPELKANQNFLELQAQLVKQRREGVVPDTLLLLEHPHVITLGSGSHDENVLVTPQERAERGIELFDTGRGGDVTYHGPGQLVGYPIFDLKPDRQDLHRYLRDIEEALIGVLSDFGLRGGRKDGLTGVWVDDRKLGAIGVLPAPVGAAPPASVQEDVLDRPRHGEDAIRRLESSSSIGTN